MKVLFGLGNPETKYTGTRHNVGFWALDQIAASYDIAFKAQTKLHALVAEMISGGERVLLVKPTTYYNEVGQSARAIMDFYKLSPENFLIVHDDLALPLGTIRTRMGGSSGGNNGLKSLEQHIGSATPRLRIGVWVDTHHGTDKVSLVLGKFGKQEQDILNEQRDTIVDITNNFAAGQLEVTTRRSQ